MNEVKKSGGKRQNKESKKLPIEKKRSSGNSEIGYKKSALPNPL
jgi:hypothetical protein